MNSPSQQELIRDIWEQHILIQEQLIRQRSAPISIDPESAEVNNGKLSVRVDENVFNRDIDYILRNDFKLQEYNLEDGYIMVDDNVLDKISQAQLESIKNSLAAHYLDIDIAPSINATIKYGKGERFDKPAELKEIAEIDARLQSSDFVLQGKVNDIIPFIARITVDKEALLRHYFGDHVKVHRRTVKEEERVRYSVEYVNQYIPFSELQKYRHDIGVFCKQYKLKFFVSNKRADLELYFSFDPSCYSSADKAFVFKREFTEDDQFNEATIQEINDNITAFYNECRHLCSKDEIKVECSFSYGYSTERLLQKKYAELYEYTNTHSNMSFSLANSQIGIDFNWRTENIDDIIADIESTISGITIEKHSDHKYKYKVEASFAGIEDIQNRLQSRFEKIVVSNNTKTQVLSVSLPYGSSSYYNHLRKSLEEELSSINFGNSASLLIDNKIPGKACLRASYNADSRIEDIEDSIKEMRKADFGIQVLGKEIPFGKLIRVNYPNLTFDISLDDEKAAPIIEAFEAKSIDSVIPILTGDLEKISRLRNTFTMATSGNGLMNEHLQNYIFDSSQATPTEDIDTILKEEGGPYNELNRNLLNSKVNESQKQAILKCIYAKDLAVIQGPPGTGKSTAIAELIWQLIRNGLKIGNAHERILLTSETNLAVDNAISRIVNSKTNLVKPIRFGDETKLESEGLQFSLDLMKEWVEKGDAALTSDEQDEETGQIKQNDLVLKNWLHNISNRSFYGMEDEDNEIVKKWRHLLSSPSAEMRKTVFDNYVKGCNVVGATCSSIGERKAIGKLGFTPFYNTYSSIFGKGRNRKSEKIDFTTVIQDESSKATPAELVLPFVYGRKSIVIGDHRQLPPLLDQEEIEDSLNYALSIAKNDIEKDKIRGLLSYVKNNFAEMEISHFENLYKAIDDSLKASFNLQYRMHPSINQVIEQFYKEDKGLKCGLIFPRDLGVNEPNFSNPASRYHGINIPGLIDEDTHVLFVQANSPEMLDGTSRVNYGEVSAIDKILTRFEESLSFHEYLAHFIKDEDKQIGIISFYGKQIKQIRSMTNHHPALPIRVSTVDRFQGMERNIIIVSMVRSHMIQLCKDQQPNWDKFPDSGYPKQTSLGFAQSPNRLNVALSRAKRLLVIVGDEELFSSKQIYKELFETIRNNNTNKIITSDEL